MIRKITQKIKNWFWGENNELSHEDASKILSDVRDRGLLASDDFDRMTGSGKHKNRKTVK